MFLVEHWKNSEDKTIIIRANKQTNGNFGGQADIHMPDFSESESNAFLKKLNKSLKTNKTHHAFFRQKGFYIKLVITDDPVTAELSTKAGNPTAFATNDMAAGQSLIDNVKHVASVEVLTKQTAPGTDTVQ